MSSMRATKQILEPKPSWLTQLAAVALAAILLAGCGSGSKTTNSKTGTTSSPPRKASAKTHSTPTVHVSRPPAASYPKVIPGGLSAGSPAFVPVAKWHGQTVAWIAHLPSGVQMLSFDQHHLTLHLHSGTLDAGASGWRFGPEISHSELPRVVAAFNGGFRLAVGVGGFESNGRVAVPLRAGLASIVTYANGSTDVGSWRGEVPAAGQRVTSVRQNLTLLIDHGHPAATVDCVSCWGATLGGVVDPARAALGVAANGHLVWAAGEHVTPATLADALVHAHVVRAAELDINPEWVAGYLYAHHSFHSPPVPLAVVQGQVGIPGEFLVPWSRDFFTVVVR